MSPDGTTFTREELQRLAILHHEPLFLEVRHRDGTRGVCPRTMAQLAAAVHLEGKWFGSKLEAARYMELLKQQRDGEISELKCQVPFDLHAGPEVIKVGRFVADFTYQRGGLFVVEDTKGVRTAEFIRKKKHVEAEYGLVVTEVRRGEKGLR